MFRGGIRLKMANMLNLDKSWYHFAPLIAVLIVLASEEATAAHCKYHSLNPKRTTVWVTIPSDGFFSFFNEGPAQVIVGQEGERSTREIVRKLKVFAVMGPPRTKVYITLRNKKWKSRVEICLP